MAADTSVRTMQLPTVDASGDELKLDCSWTAQYGYGAEAKWIDKWWCINGHWWSHGTGVSVSESANYTCQLAEIKGWGSIWKPIRTVQFCMRYAFEKKYGPWVYSPVLTLLVPNPPKIEIEQIEKNGAPWLKVTITREASTWNRPSLQTKGSVQIGLKPGIVGPPSVDTFETRSETWTNEYSLAMLSESLSAPVSIVVRASAVGLAGESATVTKTYYVSRPNVPTIKSIVANRDDVTSAVTVNFDANADVTHPVDRIELLRLRDSALESASEVALVTNGWTGVASVIGGACSACDLLSDARPTSRGKRTWYRVKSTHGSHSTYSLPVQLPVYDAPLDVSAAGAYIASVAEAADGRSVAVEVAWRDLSVAGASAGELAGIVCSTEVSWGSSPYSWMSTEGVKTFEFGWECDGAEKEERLAIINAGLPTVDGQTVEPYTHVGVVYVEGIDETSVAYIKARRVWEEDGETGYGEYSNMVVASMSASSNIVLLTAPATICRGEGLGLTWSVGADVAQSEWLVSGVAADSEALALFDDLAAEDAAERAAAKAELDASCVGLAFGYDSAGYVAIDPEDLDGIDMLLVKVSVNIGGMVDDSAYALVDIADPPVCEIEVPDVVTSTPASIVVKTDANDKAVVGVVSRGIAYAAPDGTRYQRSGDVVFGKVASIEDFELGEDGMYAGTISLEGAALVDGGTYDVNVYVEDPATGLLSAVAASAFTVAFEHQAGVPDANISANADDLSATIELIAPEEAAEGDVCDVYRVTPYGADIIASDVEFGSVVVDRFAPFVCDLEQDDPSYRIACKTKDGDVAWRDVASPLRASTLRLDWGERSSLELPYNVALSESAAKLFGAKTMLDGSRIGSWQEGVERTGTFSTDIIRFRSAAQHALVNEVAAYPGPVFVRSGDGHAFEANVEISEIETSFDSSAVGVSLSFEQIDLTDAHRCAIDDIIAPEEEQDQ